MPSSPLGAIPLIQPLTPSEQRELNNRIGDKTGFVHQLPITDLETGCLASASFLDPQPFCSWQSCMC